MLIKNVSPLGDLEIAGVGLVPYGGTFEATGDDAKRFLEDAENYRRADRPQKRASAEPTEPEPAPTEAEQSAATEES